MLGFCLLEENLFGWRAADEEKLVLGPH